MTTVSKGTGDKPGSVAVSSAIAVQGKEASAKLEAWLFAGEKPRKLSIAELLQGLGTELDADKDAFERADLADQVELFDDFEFARAVMRRAPSCTSARDVRGARPGWPAERSRSGEP